MEAKLKSAESTIQFLQKDHERVLHGLHMEIERLQQKCSDLQFALAHQTASAETEAELRSFIVGLQGESDLNKDLVLSLQAELERSQQKVIELEEQLRWQQMENQNVLNNKDAKILELKKALKIDEPKTESSKLQKSSSLSPFLKEDICKKRLTQQMVLKPTLVPISRENPAAIANLSPEDQKRKLQSQLQKNRKPWSINAGKSHQMSENLLPVDFKATVATLPPIVTKQVNVQSLAVDLDFVKTKHKLNHVSNL